MFLPIRVRGLTRMDKAVLVFLERGVTIRWFGGDRNVPSRKNCKPVGAKT